MSSIFYLTVEPGNRTKQEIVSCTTVTQNANNTATLSGCSRGLLPITPYTASSTYAFAHGGGTSVVFSNPPQFYNQFLAADNNGTITGEYTFNGAVTFSSTSLAVYDGHPCTGASASTTICDKDYIDNVALQGAATSSNTQAGITKISVAAADANNPIAVGDNDTRVPTQGENDALVGSLGTPSSSNKYLTEQMATTTATSSYLVKYDTNGTINAYSISVSTTTTSSTSSVASVAYVDSSRWISYSTSTNVAIPTGANLAFIQCNASYSISGAGSAMLFIDKHIGTSTVNIADAAGNIMTCSSVWTEGGNLTSSITTGSSGSSIAISFYK